MIETNLYEQIRYLYAVEKLSKREIATRQGVSRNTVKRYCNGENVPWERKPRQGKCPVTDPIRETVKEWLESGSGITTEKSAGVYTFRIRPWRSDPGGLGAGSGHCEW
ncbi:hypothetical protein [Desulfofundulus sp.]|uniref:hypothetical protein n=1 Tax=Desulfofundulus sp. TaxID=2282750 RepID=UPI003C7432DF